MSSPEVWTDARARIEAVAADLALAVIWPNEAGEEPEADGAGTLPPFLAVTIEADAGEPIEIGTGATWEERGTLWAHVLVPSGSGIAAGLALRKGIADAFRGLPPGVVCYGGFMFPAGGTDEASGNWFRLSLGVSYSFTDR